MNSEEFQSQYISVITKERNGAKISVGLVCQSGPHHQCWSVDWPFCTRLFTFFEMDTFVAYFCDASPPLVNTIKGTFIFSNFRYYNLITKENIMLNWRSVISFMIYNRKFTYALQFNNASGAKCFIFAIWYKESSLIFWKQKLFSSFCLIWTCWLQKGKTLRKEMLILKWITWDHKGPHHDLGRLCNKTIYNCPTQNKEIFTEVLSRY